MACSHEGNIELAKKIIAGAGDAGADAIQFQIFDQVERATPNHPDFDLLGQLEFSHDEWTELTHLVRQQYPEMDIIACVYEHGSVDFSLKLGVDAYKLHSADLSNPNMIEYVAGTGKRIDLGHFPLPKKYTGEWRVDTHPRQSRDGHQICIDAPYKNEGRQLYLIDISSIFK